MSVIIKNPIIVAGKGGGTELAPLTKPATAAEIKAGYQAYGDDGKVIVGAYTVSDVHPQLNPVTIAKSGNNLNITNPSTNGNFVAGYKVMSGGSEVTRVDKSPLLLTTLQAQPYTFTVRAHGVGFLDSPDSNAIDITVYAFVDGLKNVTTDFDFEKTTSGMTFSFTIVAAEGYHLPASISIKCNGEDVDFSYNPYTGEVTTTAPLKTAYSGEVTDGGKLIAPVISMADTDELEVSDVAFAETYELYQNEQLAGTYEVPAGGYIGVAAEGVVTPQLMQPLAILDNDTLEIVDGYLKEGDVFYSETYDLYKDEDVFQTGIDATAEQATLFSYKTEPDAQWQKNSDGSMQTKQSSVYANTYAHMRIGILAPKATKVKVEYTFYPYNSYVRMYIGKLNKSLEKSVTKVPASADCQAVASGTGTTTNSFTVDVPKGASFIDVLKQYNTTSTSSTYYNRYCKVKITEVVEETA